MAGIFCVAVSGFVKWACSVSDPVLNFVCSEPDSVFDVAWSEPDPVL